MKVFISWSGIRSKRVASALSEWLPDIIQNISPWMSDHDIYAGAKWNIELGKILEASNFGVICLTPENIEKPWVLFEAGSLSKSITESRLVPFRIGLEATDLEPPLSQFQGVDANHNGVYRLISSINQANIAPLPEERLKRIFEKMWPELESQLNEILMISVEDSIQKRTEIDYLKEILELVRNSREEKSYSNDLQYPTIITFMQEASEHWNEVVENMREYEKKGGGATTELFWDGLMEKNILVRDKMRRALKALQ